MLRVFRCCSYWVKNLFSIRTGFRPYGGHGCIKNIQLEKLRTLLQFCWDEVPFYRELWVSHGVKSPSISSVEDIARFPAITKGQLRDGLKRGLFINVSDWSGGFSWQETTGSTGEPFRYPQETDLLRKKRAVSLRTQSWTGFRPGDVYVRLWRGDVVPSLRTRIVQTLTGVYTISIYDPVNVQASTLSQARLHEIFCRLSELRPAVIDGFVSALVLLAAHMKKNKLSVTWPLKAIVTGAEVLTDDDRKIVEEGFGVGVFNRYGGTESSILAHECAHQSRTGHQLHVQPDRHVMELVDESGKPVANGAGAVAFTDLDSFLFPFVRYLNGDTAVWGDRICSCGIEFPMLKEVIGRTNEYFILPEGGRISSHLWQNYFKKYVWLNEYQMVQKTLVEVDVSVVINDDLFRPDEYEKLQKKVSCALPGIDVRWQIVSMIPRAKGGKLNQHICMVRDA